MKPNTIILPNQPEVVFMPKDWTLTHGSPWADPRIVPPEAYRCGFCGRDVSSDRGWLTQLGNSFIRICPQCNVPTFFAANGLRIPGSKSGASLTKVPKEILGLYEEARSSRSANAFTGTVMLCRKLLMHVAVEKKADVDKTFAYYVDFLVKERYAPRGAEKWLGYIKDRANEANHDIVLMTEMDADGLLHLTEQLLRNVYELPESVPPSSASQSRTDNNAP